MVANGVEHRKPRVDSQPLVPLDGIFVSAQSLVVLFQPDVHQSNEIGRWKAFLPARPQPGENLSRFVGFSRSTEDITEPGMQQRIVGQRVTSLSQRVQRVVNAAGKALGKADIPVGKRILRVEIQNPPAAVNTSFVVAPVELHERHLAIRFHRQRIKFASPPRLGESLVKAASEKQHLG